MRNMKKQAIAKTAVIASVLVLALSGGVSLYSSAKEGIQIEETRIPTAVPLASVPSAAPAVSEPAAGSVELSADELAAIKQSAPSAYEHNVSNYKKFLATFDVHQTYRERLKASLLGGSKMPDLLTAYEFVYQQFGTYQDVEKLTAGRASGESWRSLFREYLKREKVFVPRAFDPDYLESLQGTSGITSDDIMIADQVSFKTGKSVQELINNKIAGQDWKEQSSSLGLVFSGKTLPRVSVTAQQLEKYTASKNMTRDQAVKAVVLANKLEWQADDTVRKLLDGATEAALYEEAYTAKYGLAEQQ